MNDEFGHRDERSGAHPEEEGEIFADEEVYEQKPNKKWRKQESSGDVNTESGNRGKKAKKVEEQVSEGNGEAAEETVYDKELKNVSNKKNKKYNKKYESAKRHDLEDKGEPTYEQLNPDNDAERQPQKTKKRVRRSENKEKREGSEQLPERRPQEKGLSAIK